LLQQLDKLGPVLLFKKLPGCWRAISLRQIWQIEDGQIEDWHTEDGQVADRR
jgi:hypothetical protein